MKQACDSPRTLVSTIARSLPSPSTPLDVFHGIEARKILYLRRRATWDWLSVGQLTGVFLSPVHMDPGEGWNAACRGARTAGRGRSRCDTDTWNLERSLGLILSYAALGCNSLHLVRYWSARTLIERFHSVPFYASSPQHLSDYYQLINLVIHVDFDY